MSKILKAMLVTLVCLLAGALIPRASIHAQSRAASPSEARGQATAPAPAIKTPATAQPKKIVTPATPALKPAPTLKSTPASPALQPQPASKTPSIIAVLPRQVTLKPTGPAGRKRLTFTGLNLEKLTSAKLMLKGKGGRLAPASGVTVILNRGSSGKGAVTLWAAPQATPSSQYQLVLYAGRKSLKIPLNTLRLTVAAPLIRKAPKAATGLAQAKPVAAGKKAAKAPEMKVKPIGKGLVLPVPSIPMSGKVGYSWQKVGGTFLKLPDIELKVKQPTPDKSVWGYHFAENRWLPVNLRWLNRRDDLVWARWEVSKNKEFSQVIARKSLTAIPSKGSAYQFSIDFSAFEPHSTSYPNTRYVRVIGGATSPSLPGGGQPVVGKAPEPVMTKLAVSTMVMVQRVKEGEPTTISGLPKLRVRFYKIEVIDDSDDMGAGELGFAFWVHNSEPKYYVAQIDSDSSVNIDKRFAIEAPPSWAVIRVYGYDDDATEVLPYGAFIILLSNSCGAVPAPGDECADGDIAEGSVGVTTGIGEGNKMEEKDAYVYVGGPSLKCKVYFKYSLF